jgi:cysteine desulfurase
VRFALKEFIYLDNSATTKPCKEAVDNINFAMCENWGNPSSLHTVGIRAEDILISCREVCAKQLSARPDEIYFTSGGTEANNIAINGAVLSRAKRGNRIVTTQIEHPSVSEAIDIFAAKGFEIIKLKPQANGCISEAELAEAINDKTVLVSIMLVNNEIGSIQPVRTAAEIIKKKNSPALLHCDAVQAFGKIPIKVSELGVDMLTFSGHKIHGPKGIGVLYKKKSVHIHPLTFGGGQQNNLRPRTEPTPLIAGLEGAITALPNLTTQLAKTKELCEYAKAVLLQTGLCEINSPEDALPYVLNISVPGFRSETLLHFLDAKGIFVSSGSACSKGGLSPTLSALGLSDRRIDSALRISFSRFNTKDDINKLAEGIKAAATKLKRS